jgi:catechol 2,3-dioxygenase-like lactoylglutathione lyase family enzyme
MERVTGLGGVVFTCADPEATREWYRTDLGIESTKDGAIFPWREMDDHSKTGQTVWSLFPATTHYFDPAGKSFMLNYRVGDVERLIEQLRAEGVTIVGSIEKYPYGKFGWIMDPDENKIELWEPIDEKQSHL